MTECWFYFARPLDLAHGIEVDGEEDDFAACVRHAVRCEPALQIFGQRRQSQLASKASHEADRMSCLHDAQARVTMHVFICNM